MERVESNEARSVFNPNSVPEIEEFFAGDCGFLDPYFGPGRVVTVSGDCGVFGLENKVPVTLSARLVKSWFRSRESLDVRAGILKICENLQPNFWDIEISTCKRDGKTCPLAQNYKALVEEMLKRIT